MKNRKKKLTKTGIIWSRLIFFCSLGLFIVSFGIMTTFPYPERAESMVYSFLDIISLGSFISLLISFGVLGILFLMSLNFKKLYRHSSNMAEHGIENSRSEETHNFIRGMLKFTGMIFSGVLSMFDAGLASSAASDLDDNEQDDDDIFGLKHYSEKLDPNSKHFDRREWELLMYDDD